VSSVEDEKNRGTQCEGVTFFSVIDIVLQKSCSVMFLSVEVLRRSCRENTESRF